MKKFMKAIAFVTVMCMALSTVAFAAGTLGEATDKTFTVTVTGAVTDQVALMVVAAVEGDDNPAYDFSNPLYIDQKAAAGAEGKAEFTAKIAAGVDAVDVYVGYASNTTPGNKAAYLGEVELVEAVTEITVTKVKAEAAIENNTEAESDIGEAWTIDLTVTAPDGVYATDMVWAITYEDSSEADGEKTVYSEPMEIDDYSIGSVVDGDVTLGVAFNNGSTLRGLGSVTVKTVDVIFMFSNDVEKATDEDVFSAGYVEETE